MYRAIQSLIQRCPTYIFKIFTVDRGKEFACYDQVLGIPVYFADASSSCCIGSNENANGLFRENFLKKTDLARVSDEEIHEAICLMNHRPRKGLGWKTSLELINCSVHFYC